MNRCTCGADGLPPGPHERDCGRDEETAFYVCTPGCVLNFGQGHDGACVIDDATVLARWQEAS